MWRERRERRERESDRHTHTHTHTHTPRTTLTAIAPPKPPTAYRRSCGSGTGTRRAWPRGTAAWPTCPRNPSEKPSQRCEYEEGKGRHALPYTTVPPPSPRHNPSSPDSSRSSLPLPSPPPGSLPPRIGDAADARVRGGAGDVHHAHAAALPRPHTGTPPRALLPESPEPSYLSCSSPLT